MKSNIAERILAKTPEDVKIFASFYAALAVRVSRVIAEKGLTQKALADKLGKKPSEIHKWLNGEHNFTLRSIAKLQAELGEILIEIPTKKQPTEFISSNEKKTYALIVPINRGGKNESKEEWKHLSNATPLANVG